MPRSQKRNALIIVVLIGLFQWWFMFLKHDPALRDMIPFGVDPYDAVGSFALIVGVLITLLSLLRAFRPYRAHPPTSTQRLYLVRAQMAVVLAILTTLVVDGVAMARHPSAWMQPAGPRIELLILLACMAALTIAVGALVRPSVEPVSARTPTTWLRPAAISLGSLLVLAVYPEQLIENTTIHLLTVVLGALLLFVQLRVLLPVIVPADRQQTEVTAAASRKTLYGWALVTITGIGIGALMFVAEMTDGGGAALPPLSQVILIACVFVGLATVGLLLAYAFVRAPLGL